MLIKYTELLNAQAKLIKQQSDEIAALKAQIAQQTAPTQTPDDDVEVYDDDGTDMSEIDFIDDEEDEKPAESFKDAELKKFKKKVKKTNTKAVEKLEGKGNVKNAKVKKTTSLKNLGEMFL